MVKRFEVYLINLDPTRGTEIKNTRPCVVLSPDEFSSLKTFIVAPMTTTYKPYPTRVGLSFAGKKGYIVLDQIRTIDQDRMVKKLGNIDRKSAVQSLAILQEMFEF